MAWIETKLYAGEEIVFQSRAHKSIFCLPLLLMIIGFSAFIDTELTVGLLYFSLGTLLLFINGLRYFYKEFIITTERIITGKGIFYKHLIDIPMESVDDVIFNQSMAEKLFGTGKITIFGAGISSYQFKGISRAKDFYHAIYSQLPAKKNPYFDEA